MLPWSSLLPGITNDVVLKHILPRVQDWSKRELRLVNTSLRAAIDPQDCVSYANAFVRCHKGVRPPSFSPCDADVENAFRLVYNNDDSIDCIWCPPEYHWAWLREYPSDMTQQLFYMAGGTDVSRCNHSDEPEDCSYCGESFVADDHGHYLVYTVPVGLYAGDCHDSCAEAAQDAMEYDVQSVILKAYRERLEIKHPGFDVAMTDIAECKTIGSFLRLFSEKDFQAAPDFWDLNKAY
jgi:hypothetical protein